MSTHNFLLDILILKIFLLYTIIFQISLLTPRVTLMFLSIQSPNNFKNCGPQFVILTSHLSQFRLPHAASIILAFRTIYWKSKHWMNFSQLILLLQRILSLYDTHLFQFSRTHEQTITLTTAYGYTLYKMSLFCKKKKKISTNSRTDMGGRKSCYQW